MQTSLFSKQSSRDKHLQSYKVAYEKLNHEQQEAVDQVEGPVMVVAGPGTGKTQILAVRIGKILLETDAQAHNILCLTYTDAATLSMRNRLVRIIGPEAHKVQIHTFHSFCNQVIQENLGLFGNYRQLEPLSDLERVDVFARLMDELPDDHRLKRLKGNDDIIINRLANLFSLMKKENYNEDRITESIEQYYGALKDDPDMLYKRSGKGYTKGDFKQKEFDKISAKMEDLRAGSGLLEIYKNILSKLERYDYDDMILWVLNAFSNDEDLLLQYQERFQYFLVDEFQDTNGSQKDLLEALISFWEESPNVFVVGDDDQAIYKFQGANLGNIKSFYDKYSPSIVVLKQNYRSSQSILDAAMGLIDYNAERIIKQGDLDLDKNLVAKSEHKDINENVHIVSYANVVQEQAAIVKRLVSRHKNNQDLSRCAIIYRNHRQVEKIVEVLEKKGIPINIKRKVDILKLPLVRNILNILTYVNAQYLNKGYSDRLLFEILHYNFFSIRAHDISKLIWETRNSRTLDESENDHGKTPLANLIADEQQLENLGIESKMSILKLQKSLDKWISEVGDVTLQVLFQNIINEGRILKTILLQPNQSWLLQVVNTLFNLIKEETTKNPELSLQEFLDMIEKMRDNQIKLEVNKVVSAKHGAHFLTAHSSKGLEFEEVFLIGANKKIWDKRRGGMHHFSYPPDMNADNDVNTEDERRLFYVGMTRSERQLYMTYALSEENGKELGASQFIDELISVSDLNVYQDEVAEEVVVDFQHHVLLKKEQKVGLIDHDLVDRMLEGYQLSVTGLNKYLKCPLTFYFESVLRVPMARTKYLGFGRGIHYALEFFFNAINEGHQPDQASLLTHFDQGMNHHRAHFTKKEFRDMSTYGRQILTAYFEKYLRKRDSNVKRYELEVRIDQAEYEGIPIKGILDRVDVFGQQVIVTDYKTGNASSPYAKAKLRPPTDKYPNGGDYWRQIVFYQLLLNSDRRNSWQMLQGIMDFIEPDQKTGEFTKVSFEVSDRQIEIVGEQIQLMWQAIHNHQFEKGCGEEDCAWCSFVENEYVMSDDDWVSLNQEKEDAVE